MGRDAQFCSPSGRIGFAVAAGVIPTAVYAARSSSVHLLVLLLVVPAMLAATLAGTFGSRLECGRVSSGRGWRDGM